MRAYMLQDDAGKGSVVTTEIAKPEPGAGEVRFKVEAVSLNYRDLLVIDRAGGGGLDGCIPCSDGAGIVDALGAGVDRWQIGERVAASFFQDWVSGPYRRDYVDSARGGSKVDGVLADYVVVPEAALVAIPSHMSAIEASTLPCAAVVAWHGLVERAGMSAGDTLLIQGTGGVALFGLQIAIAMGVNVAVLSSSDAKLARAKSLGATTLINYRAVPDWDVAIMEATAGHGVSHVLELGGPDTYERSLRSVAPGGKIVQIGVLSGLKARPDLELLMVSNADIIGVRVGSAEHFVSLNAFMTSKNIRPIVDKTFRFDQFPQALDYLASGQHFGKIVIDMAAGQE